MLNDDNHTSDTSNHRLLWSRCESTSYPCLRNSHAQSCLICMCVPIYMCICWHLSSFDRDICINSFVCLQISPHWARCRVAVALSMWGRSYAELIPGIHLIGLACFMPLLYLILVTVLNTYLCCKPSSFFVVLMVVLLVP